MMDFIAANFNLPTVLIALLVIAGILLAVRSVRRSGGCKCSGNCGSCSGCSGSCSCHSSSSAPKK